MRGDRVPSTCAGLQSSPRTDRGGGAGHGAQPWRRCSWASSAPAPQPSSSARSLGGRPPIAPARRRSRGSTASPLRPVGRPRRGHPGVARGGRRRGLRGSPSDGPDRRPDPGGRVPQRGDLPADGAVAGHGALPAALHDAAAGALGGRVYLFGGGDIASTDRILRVGAAGAVASPAGRLPSRDRICNAVVGGTAYLVGGSTGTRALTSILAWRPGGSARVVARLPRPLRYSQWRPSAVGSSSRAAPTAAAAVAMSTCSTRTLGRCADWAACPCH